MQMTNKLCYVLVIFCWVTGSLGIVCYNCTSTQHKDFSCAGDFAPSNTPFNNTRYLLVNCTGDDAVCFVRSWTARARLAWMVQRGCYRTNKDDALPNSMTIPTRSMTCRQERYPDGEYKVCFCKADWCNSASNCQVNYIIIYSCIGILIYNINYIFCSGNKCH